MGPRVYARVYARVHARTRARIRAGYFWYIFLLEYSDFDPEESEDEVEMQTEFDRYFFDKLPDLPITCTREEHCEYW